MTIKVIEETKTSDGDDSDDDGDENLLQDSLASSAVLLAPQVLSQKYISASQVSWISFFHKKIFISWSTLKFLGQCNN